MRSENVFFTLSNLAAPSKWQIARSLTGLLFMLVCIDSAARADDSTDFAKACAEYSHGDYQGTFELLTGLVQGSYKGDARAHYYLGNALLGLGKLEDARKQYTAALQLPASPELKQYCQKAIEQSQSKLPSGKGNSPNSGKSNT
jgi:tetratricopeptide (TPR) repeat protein